MKKQIKKLIFFFRRLTLPVKLVVIHTLIILVAMALYPMNIFIPEPPFDDIYTIYIFVPGIHIYMIGLQLSHQLFPWLLTETSYRVASILCIVLIPGIVGILVGGLQWYFIGKAILFIKKQNKPKLR